MAGRAKNVCQLKEHRMTKKKTTPHLKKGVKTKWREDMPERLVASIKKHKFLNAAIYNIGIRKSAAHEYCALYPRFAEAFKEAKEYQESWLLQMAASRIMGRKATERGSDVMLRLMLGCAGYSEKQMIQHSGSIDAKVAVVEWGEDVTASQASDNAQDQSP